MRARLPEGYQNKGAGDMNAMIRQAQKMQEDMEVLQGKLNEREYSATSGGGLVEFVMKGDRTLKSVKIDPELIDKDNIEDLEDLIIAGVNTVLKKVEEENNTEMEKITGKMNVPGMF